MWYAANLLFKRTRASSPGGELLWEESIRLVKAESEEEAQMLAQQLGQSERVSYETSDGVVVWTFDRVERIYAIESESLVSGTELFSRFLRDSEVASLLTPFDDE
jgi:hypothetical protein